MESPKVTRVSGRSLAARLITMPPAAMPSPRAPAPASSARRDQRRAMSWRPPPLPSQVFCALSERSMRATPGHGDEALLAEGHRYAEGAGSPLWPTIPGKWPLLKSRRTAQLFRVLAIADGAVRGSELAPGADERRIDRLAIDPV